MRISIGFLLATFAVTVPAAPSPGRLAARMPITGNQLLDGTSSTSGKVPISDSNTSSNTGTTTSSTPNTVGGPGKFDSLNTGTATTTSSTPNTVGGPGKFDNWNTGTGTTTGDTANTIPNTVGGPGKFDNWNTGTGTTTGDTANTIPNTIGGPGKFDGWNTGTGTTTGDTANTIPIGGPEKFKPPQVVSTGTGISRLSDGTIIDSTSPRPIFFPNNVIPRTFNNFDSFHYTLQYSQTTFFTVVSQWQTSGFSSGLVVSQFGTWIDQMYQTVSFFQGGCQICYQPYASQFQTVATNLLRDIQFALQIIRTRYGSIWGQLTDDFQRLQIIIRLILGIAASFGISLNSWFSNLALNPTVFQAVNIPIQRYTTVSANVLLNVNQPL